MQQMAGNMGLIHPFVFNQFGNYGSYAQVIMSVKRVNI
jgi:CUG-BP- and ETR3-like factor